jgi:hypothetical protein
MSDRSALIHLEPFDIKVEELTIDGNGINPHEFVFNAYPCTRERYKLAGRELNEAAIIYDAQKFLLDYHRLLNARLRSDRSKVAGSRA